MDGRFRLLSLDLPLSLNLNAYGVIWVSGGRDEEKNARALGIKYSSVDKAH
jgi:hypothetical protein